MGVGHAYQCVQNSHVVKLSGCDDILELVEFHQQNKKTVDRLDTRPPSVQWSRAATPDYSSTFKKKDDICPSTCVLTSGAVHLTGIFPPWEM